MIFSWHLSLANLEITKELKKQAQEKLFLVDSIVQ